MSGGSYNYLYRKLEDGEVDSAFAYAETVKNDLQELFKLLQDPATEMKHFVDKTYCDLTAVERNLAGVAVTATLMQWQNVMAKLKFVTEELAKLSAVAHALEWWQSGDSGPGDPADACMKYMDDAVMKLMHEIHKPPKET